MVAIKYQGFMFVDSAALNSFLDLENNRTLAIDLIWSLAWVVVSLEIGTLGLGRDSG